jgi:hypothetical protein
LLQEARARYAHTGACIVLAPPVASLQMARAALLHLPSASPRLTASNTRLPTDTGAFLFPLAPTPLLALLALHRPPPLIRRCGRRERFYFTLCFPSLTFLPSPSRFLIPQPFRKPLSPSLHSKKAADRASDITAAFRSFIIAVIKPYNQQHSRATERRKKEGPASTTDTTARILATFACASVLSSHPTHFSQSCAPHLSAANFTAASDIPHTKTGPSHTFPTSAPRLIAVVSES